MSEANPKPALAPVVTVKGSRAPKPTPTRYDFLRPPQAGERDESAVEALFGRIATLTNAQLTARMRAPSRVVRVTTERSYFHDFLGTLPEPCVAFRFQTGGTSGGYGVLQIENAFAANLIDRMFGGGGEVDELARPLSSLERMAMQGLAERWLALLAEARRELVSPEPHTFRFEQGKKGLLQEIGDGRAVVATITFAIGAFEGSIRVCIPASTVDSLEPGARPRRAARPKGERARTPDEALVASELRRARVTLQARLPLLHLRAGAIAGLKEGQVIHTGLPIDAEAEVMVNGRLRYRASLGAVHGHIGVKISDVVLEPVAVAPATPRAGRVL